MIDAISFHPNSRPKTILLVEDNPADIGFLKDAFAEADLDLNLHVATTGTEALAFLSRRSFEESTPIPDLVLLDLNLPGAHGTEVLETIKTDSDLQHIPVVVLSGSSDVEDVVGCYERHANAFLTKPHGLDEFVSLVIALDRFWFGQAPLPAASNPT